MAQESGHGLAESAPSEFFMRLQILSRARVSSEGSTGEGSLSKLVLCFLIEFSS